MFKDIKDFHKKYDLKYDGPPRQLPKELLGFRVRFLKEELEEYCKAITYNDLEGQLDALVDLVYVAIGTAYLQGFDFGEAWSRVHDANMKKIRAKREDDSKRGTAYDVVKPEGWEPPNLKDLCIAAKEVYIKNCNNCGDYNCSFREQAVTCDKWKPNLNVAKPGYNQLNLFTRADGVI